VSAPRSAPGVVLDLRLASTPTSARSVSLLNKVTAFDYYTGEGGFSVSKAVQHMGGIDFSQPVIVTELPQGTVLQQYFMPARGIGNYFAPPGTTPLQAGLSLQGQELGYFSNTAPVRGLQSIAAPDYIWPPGGVVPGSGAGGGVQYFIPNKGAFAPASR